MLFNAPFAEHGVETFFAQVIIWWMLSNPVQKVSERDERRNLKIISVNGCVKTLM